MFRGWECKEIKFKLGLKNKSLLDGREKGILGNMKDTSKKHGFVYACPTCKTDQIVG